MPEKILGLDINDNYVTAVQVESGLKGYQVTACARVNIEGEEGLDDALKELFEQNDLKSDICVAAIPGEHISYRNLRMPFKDVKKIRQTLPFEVEIMVPFPVEELVIDFTISDSLDQSGILAVAAKKELISEYLAHLKSQGIDPDVLDIRCVPTVSLLLKQESTPDDGLFLDIGWKRSTMALFIKRRVVLIRTIAFDGGLFTGSVISDTNGGHATIQIAEQAESWFKSFCITVQNTITPALRPGSGKCVLWFRWVSGLWIHRKRSLWTRGQCFSRRTSMITGSGLKRLFPGFRRMCM